MQEKIVKSKERIKKYAEVYTPKFIVRDMCNIIPTDVWDNIESTFLEPACGNGNILAEVLERKFALCKTEKDGLKALNSIYGVDILQDNINECRERLLRMFCEQFSEASVMCLVIANSILTTHIVCDNALNPQTEIVKSWGITANNDYLKTIKKKQE